MGKAAEERVELHCHTCKSAMNAVGNVGDIIHYVSKQGMRAVGFTDLHNIYAYPDIQYCIDNTYPDIKPIYGIELLVADDILPNESLKSKILMNGMAAFYVLVLIKNEIGKNNLYSILTEANRQKKGEVPWITWSRLLELKEGLLLGSACIVGELQHACLYEYDADVIYSIAIRYDFLEIQPVMNDKWLTTYGKNGRVYSVEEIRSMQRKIVRLGENLDIPVVATSDAHYLRPKNAISRAVVLHRRGWDDMIDNEPYFRTTDEMLEEFSFLGSEKAYEIVIENTNRIADRIEIISPIENKKHSVFIENADEKLKLLCEQHLPNKYLLTEARNAAKERLYKELKCIKEQGLAFMYLHFYELINKTQLRAAEYVEAGNAAGLVVCYLLGITKENPLDQKLPLYSEYHFASYSGPKIRLKVSEEVIPRIEESLNGLSGVQRCILTAYQSTPSFEMMEEWIDNYAKDKQCFALLDDEKLRERIHRDNYDLLINCNETYWNEYIVIPGEENMETLFPLNSVKDNLKEVAYFSGWDLEKSFINYYIYPDKVCSLLARLEKKTGFYPDEEDIKSEEFWDKISEVNLELNAEEVMIWSGLVYEGFLHDFLKVYRPKSYEEYVRMISLYNGTGKENQSLPLNSDVSLDEIISTKEDIYEMLIMHGMPNEKAFELTAEISYGVYKNSQKREKIAEYLREYNVPDWFTNACYNIRFLATRADMVEYANKQLRLMYYVLHFPETFKTMYFELYGKKTGSNSKRR